ncbi:MAG: tRNA pseudouridine(55) synthase TruB [Elainellaceae cyanobacterium]
MNGFLNLHKPAGLTSHDCVARLRRRLGLKRIGHGGTLDPAATGVLPMAVGRATRLLQFLPAQKAYRATVRFGVRTDTDDLEGAVLLQAAAPHLTLAEVSPHLAAFQGTIQQIPPKYSAIQVDGRRLYDLARAGEPVAVPMRTVEIYGTEILGWGPGDFPELDVAIACGSGTYIRAIARDLGELLGVGGTLAALVRTESGGFNLADSITLEDVTPEGLISPAIALGHLPAVELDSHQAADWGHGRPVIVPASEPMLERSDYVLVSAADEFLGVAQLKMAEGGLRLVPKVVWPPTT